MRKGEWAEAAVGRGSRSLTSYRESLILSPVLVALASRLRPGIPPGREVILGGSMLRKLPILIIAAGGFLAADDGSRDSGSWSKASAAAYLDARAAWWAGWPSAARGNET